MAALALVASACGGPPPPPMRPVADVKQLMQFVVEPAADVYWDGVGTIIDQTGVTEIKPETQGEWDALVQQRLRHRRVGQPADDRRAAPKDGGEWMQMSRALVDAGEKAIRAAESHNPQAVFDVGAEVYDVCTNCHAKYADRAGAAERAGLSRAA